MSDYSKMTTADYATLAQAETVLRTCLEHSPRPQKFSYRGMTFTGVITSVKISLDVGFRTHFCLSGEMLATPAAAIDGRPWWQRLFEWGQAGIPYDGPMG